MLRGLAKAIMTRLSTLPAPVFHLRAPAATERPYVIFSGKPVSREEDSNVQVVQTLQVKFTTVGLSLGDEVQPITDQIVGLIEEWEPTIDGANVMWITVVDDPEYGDDDDGAGDVFVGEVTFEVPLQKGKEGKRNG